MEIKEIAQKIKISIESGELKAFCQDGSFPPEQTFQLKFWGDFFRDNGVEFDQYLNALNYLCGSGYLKQIGTWYNFVGK